MILEIEIEKISEVLLADGWHKVSQVGDGRSSFGTGTYDLQEAKPAAQPNPSTEANETQAKELREVEEVQTADGPKQTPDGPTPVAGARWTEADGSRVFCPVTSILAVKYVGQKKSQ
jgi:hypothetical protein